MKVTEEERADWQAQAEIAGVTLADLMRSKMGDAETVKRSPKRKPRVTREADPALLAILGRLNGNMNSIAHWASIHKNKADAAQVLAALVAIDKIFSSYRPVSNINAGRVSHEGEPDAD